MTHASQHGFRSALCALAMLLAILAIAQASDAQTAAAAGQIEWRTCQTDYNPTLVSLAIPTGTVRLRVEGAKIGGDSCNPTKDCKKVGPSPLAMSPADGYRDDQPGVFEDLGPDVLGPVIGDGNGGGASLGVLSLAPPQQSPFCTDAVVDQIMQEKLKQCDAPHEGRCIQRVELRPERLLSAGSAQRYEFRLTPPAARQYKALDVRWSIVQWKEDVAESYIAEHKVSGATGDFGQSPFVALRFNRGVLHVTVQDEHCRCTIAAAPAADGSLHHLWDASGPNAKRLAKCRYTYPAALSGKPCRSALLVTEGNGQLAPQADPPQSTGLRFEFRHARPDKGYVRVFQNDLLVVEVKGPVGYEPAEKPGETKFKIGHYRDYLVGDAAGETAMVFEGITYSEH